MSARLLPRAPARPGTTRASVVGTGPYRRNMALDFDTSHRPRRPADWDELLEAIYSATPADESHALEWKGDVDLTSKQEVARSVAREILGLANRLVAVARDRFDGWAILVLGVEPAHVYPVAVLDSSTLHPQVTAYIGADGPGWDMRYVQFRGHPVLVIEVAPPAAGDRIFALRKPIPAEGKYRTAYGQGTVFVRHQANTDIAGQADFDALAIRAQRGAAADGLEVTVSCEPAIATAYRWDVDRLESWLDGRRQSLMNTIAAAESQRKAETLADVASRAGFPAGFDVLKAMEKAASGLGERVEERRTEEQFRREVERWIGTLRVEAGGLVERFGAVVGVAPQFEVHNPTEFNYASLQVALRMSGAATAVETDDEPPELRWHFTEPPRAFGPYLKPTFTGPWVRGTAVQPLHVAPASPRTERINGGSFVLRPPSINLRPFAREVIEDETVILIPVDRAEAPTLEWSATATNVNGEARGTIDLVPGEPIDLVETFLEASAVQRFPREA